MECPYCRLLISNEPAVACDRCNTPHHLECWQELGGCSVEGCSRMVQVKQPELDTWWGSTVKRCPYCAEDIPVAETTCPKCGAQFEGTRPLEVANVLPKAEDEELRSVRRTSRWLLVFSLLPPTSPFALIFGALWYRDHRAQILRAGGDARALALISFGVCVLYLAVLVLGLLVFQLRAPSAS
jgi:hypothetical protein